MLENVSKFGVEGFYTYHEVEGEMFRPCATRLTEEEAVLATRIEALELTLMTEASFSEVLFSGVRLGNFLLPTHLHPFMWQRRDEQDVLWYNKINVPYVCFLNYRTNEQKYLPKELTLYSDRSSLTFSPQEGYSFDTDLEKAKLKAIVELLEKDVITLWWHRETISRTIILDDNSREDILSIYNLLIRQEIAITLLDIKNDLGIYVVVCILNTNDYPSYAYGSSGHFDINEAVKHAIFEAVSCIAGLRYEFIHFKRIESCNDYPEFIFKNSKKKLSEYQRICSLETVLDKYDIYVTYARGHGGYIAKAYCFELQSSLYCDTVPLTKRFFMASREDIQIKRHHPFL